MNGFFLAMLNSFSSVDYHLFIYFNVSYHIHTFLKNWSGKLITQNTVSILILL